MQISYARVIIDISHEKVDRPFCYKVPEHLLEKIEVGSCVEVPFGKGNTLRKGYVIEFMETPDFDPNLIILYYISLIFHIKNRRSKSIRLLLTIKL